MKNIYFFTLIVVFIALVSCSDEFNINGPYQDIYVLNCILRNDQSVQYAIISKNVYTEKGTVPPSNNSDQNIKGAIIKITHLKSEYVMRDTTIQITDSGSTTMIDCYYAKGLTFYPGNEISVEATLPDGQILKSTIRIPFITYGGFSAQFPQVYKSGYQARPYFSWSWLQNMSPVKDVLSIPMLEVIYKKYEGGTYVDGKKLVPLVFYYNIDERGNQIPVDVDFSFDGSCLTTLENVNKAMQEISGEDPHKQNYIITKVSFSVQSMDADLSKYYSAYQTYAKDFTIKLRQTDYTNIEGGKGIFGMYYKFPRYLTVDSLYVNSFGYKYRPNFTGN